MADVPYQSLYRRYRSQRFDEVRGQDHVTKGLRNAVREGRVGHAYLFSGPRGTGKTSTARILAKVLNCAAPEDGEPCGRCDNCQAVERGQVVDWLLEQDAASKSKVDDMRDLLDRVPLGTSGNRKVIILDEVHMLSQGAENALLKTLEEPPAHVVFVLATTDPQKVRPTIRSRTQHNEFRLLPPDVMAEHVRYVMQDAGLDLDESVVAYVVRAGAGSVRDALSALDQVAALGEVVSDDEPVDTVIDALVAKDAGAVLVAVAEATASGRDVRGLGEALIARLRDAFLAVMGVGDDHLPAADRARASEVGDALGAAGLTRALEVLGEALMELARKPDPRVVVEVALVRLVRPEADRDIDAILQRLERLEGSGAAPQQSEPPQPTGAPQKPASQPAQSRPASQARAVLAEKKTTKRSKPEPRAEEPSPAHEDPPTESSSGASTPKPKASGESGGSGAVDLAELTKVWTDQVIGELPIAVRSKWRGGKWVESGEAGVARFSVPNEWHKKACEKAQVEVEKALAEHISGGVRVEVVVDGAAAAAPTPQREPDDPVEEEEVVDVASLPDADQVTGGVDLLVQEFDGELVEGKDNE